MNNNRMGFSDVQLIEGMKEAAAQLPELPVREVANGLRKIAHKSQELLASFAAQPDCPDTEIIGKTPTALSLEPPCK